MAESSRMVWRLDEPAGYAPRRLVVDVARAAKRHRMTGHAAEMAFFAVLTLVPSTIAVGAALGASRHILGVAAVNRAEDAVIDGVRTLMGPDLANTVIAPFVHVQLTQANGGVALGSLLAAWWLSGRLFESTAHALDTCYGVPDGRHTLVRRVLALGFALASVVLVTATIEMMVVGPLGDPDAGPARWLGLGDAYAIAWSVLRWPVLLAVVVGFLLSLYRFCPSVRHRVHDCLPGAVVGAGLWIVAAVGFRLSAPLGLHSASGLANNDPTVTLIGQSVNAVVATIIWAYFASIAIVLGGEVNAALRTRRLALAATRAALAERTPRFTREEAPRESVSASAGRQPLQAALQAARAPVAGGPPSA